MEYFTNYHDPEVKHTKGNFQVKYDKGITSQYVDTIVDAYVPVTLTIEKEKIKETHIPGLTSILKPAIEKLLHTKIQNIEVIYRQDYYVFNPINQFGTSVYENADYLNRFYKTLDLENLSGYTLLTDSPFARYTLQNMSVENVRYFLNMAILPIGDMSTLELLALQGDIDLKISTLELQGYFTYHFGIFDLEDQELVRELCMLFHIQIVDDTDVSTYILQTDVDFYTTPETWLRKIYKLLN